MGIIIGGTFKRVIKSVGNLKQQKTWKESTSSVKMRFPLVAYVSLYMLVQPSSPASILESEYDSVQDSDSVQDIPVSWLLPFPFDVILQLSCCRERLVPIPGCPYERVYVWIWE